MDRRNFDGLRFYDIEVVMLRMPGGHIDDTYTKTLTAISWKNIGGFTIFYQEDGTETDVVCSSYVHSIEIINKEKENG